MDTDKRITIPRPDGLNEDECNTAISLASEGRSLGRIFEELEISAYYFWKCVEEDTFFEKRFTSARNNGLECIADNLLDIVELEPDVNKARLLSDNSKWILSKRKPKVYGDKIDVNISQTVDIGAALSEAKSRVITEVTPLSLDHSSDRTQDVIETEVIPVSDDDIFK